MRYNLGRSQLARIFFAHFASLVVLRIPWRPECYVYNKFWPFCLVWPELKMGWTVEKR
jgi:hypothetical protein